MNKLVLTGRTREGGQMITLNKLTSFTLQAGLDSPAVLFTAGGRWGDYPPSLSHVTLQQGGVTLFSGVVDELVTSIGPLGNQFQLEARSKGATLLDNEAPPGSLYSANMATVFSLLAGKSGFSCSSFPLGRVAQFALYKGQSRWQALCDFSKILTGASPYCVGERVFFALPKGNNHWVFSNQQEGEEFTQLQHISSPYKVISKVYLQDREGYYSSSLSSPWGQKYPHQRERYLIPPSEFSSASQTGAYELLSASVQAAETYKLSLPRLIHPHLGDTASVNQSGFQLHNLVLVDYQLHYGPKGPSTHLSFQHPTF